MRRPLTWASGGLLAAIFLVLSALVTHVAAQAPASSAAAQMIYASAAAPSPPHHPAARADQYTRQAVHSVSLATEYTARKGDTLSSIARAWLGHANRWPALWYANRKVVRNPDALRVGTQLSLAVPVHPVHAWLAAEALAAIPRPPAPKPVPAPAQLAASTPEVSTGTSAVPVAPAVPAAATGSITPGSGYEACVIDHESGGNAGAVNSSSGAGGLYGFLPSTWQSLGYSGLPEDAPVSEQQQAFNQLYAEAGSAPWMTDGC